MNKLILLAASIVAFELHAQEPLPNARPASRHIEISIRDLPQGSEKELDTAVREYSKTLRGDRVGTAQFSRSPGSMDVEKTLAMLPKEHVYEIDDAAMQYVPKESSMVTKNSALMIKPINTTITSACTLLGTETSGVYSQKRQEHSGFSRSFRCPDGDVYIRDMTFFGMRKIVIKEQNNVMVGGVSGQMAGYRDKSGNSYTTLKWVSHDIDHAVQKSGVDNSTRNWLIQYAEEIIAKEGK